MKQSVLIIWYCMNCLIGSAQSNIDIKSIVDNIETVIL